MAPKAVASEIGTERLSVKGIACIMRLFTSVSTAINSSALILAKWEKSKRK